MAGDEDTRPSPAEIIENIFNGAQEKLYQLIHIEQASSGGTKEPFRFKTILDNGLDIRDSQGRPVDLTNYPITGKMKQLCEKVEGYDDKVTSYLSLSLVKGINQFFSTIDEPIPVRKQMAEEIITSMQSAINEKKAELAEQTDSILSEQLQDATIHKAVSKMYTGLDDKYSGISADEVALKDLTLHKEDIVLRSMYTHLVDKYDASIVGDIIGLSRMTKNTENKLETDNIVVESIDSDHFDYHIVRGGYLNLSRNIISVEDEFKQKANDSGVSVLYVSGDSLDLSSMKEYSEELSEKVAKWMESGKIRSEARLKAMQMKDVKNMQNEKALQSALNIITGTDGKLIVHENTFGDNEEIASYEAESVEVKDGAVHATVTVLGNKQTMKVFDLEDGGFRPAVTQNKHYLTLSAEMETAGMVVADGVVSKLTEKYIEDLGVSDSMQIVQLQMDKPTEEGNMQRATNMALKSQVDKVADSLDISYATSFENIDKHSVKTLEKASMREIGKDTYLMLETEDAKGGAVLVEGMGDTAKMAAKEVAYAVDTVKVMEEDGITLLPGLNAAYLGMFRSITENLDSYKEQARDEITTKLFGEMETRIALNARSETEGKTYIEKTVDAAVHKFNDKYGEDGRHKMAEAFLKLEAAKGETYVNAKENFYTTIAEGYKGYVKLVAKDTIVKELESRGNDMLGVTNNGYIVNPLEYHIDEAGNVETPYVILGKQVDIDLAGHYAMEAISDMITL